MRASNELAVVVSGTMGPIVTGSTVLIGPEGGARIERPPWSAAMVGGVDPGREARR